MKKEAYKISLEIAGPTAIWTRPDTGDSPGTYPAPTRSAAKGVFEAILWNPAVEIMPTRVEICAPLQYHRYATSYGGPLRKSNQIKDDRNYQLFATVLINVRYRLYAKLYPTPHENLTPRIRQWLEHTRSPCHAFRDIFERRLRRGQCHYVPSLGWREFVPSFVGEAQDTPIQADINVALESMPERIFSSPNCGNRREVKYTQGLRIEAGVLNFGDHHAE
jgi:CRISPR-associated protein Cas5d